MNILNRIKDAMHAFKYGLFPQSKIVVNNPNIVRVIAVKEISEHQFQQLYIYGKEDYINNFKKDIKYRIKQDLLKEIDKYITFEEIDAGPMVKQIIGKLYIDTSEHE